MKKPYIICHMMTSLDGRIDCAMTSLLPGVSDYYKTLDLLDIPTTLSGRVTAELEMALPGKFSANDNTPYNKEGFSKKSNKEQFEIIADTKGTLLWPDAGDENKPYLIITSEKVTKEYLDYLDGLNISWIACGKEKIDLKRACEILTEKFNIKRMGIVGGAAINTAFLNEELLDEISILIGAGIDARAGMPSVFDGRDKDFPLTLLKLLSVEKFESGAVLLRYKTK